jgi:peptidoglycan hydrolase-like protein with peptidoglycan-binding domain
MELKRWRHSALIRWGAVVALALLLGWWSAAVTLRPAAPEPTKAEPATYQVVPGNVGRSLTFSATATWPRKTWLRSGASGTVTSVEVHPGQEVTTGDVLFRIDERPMIVAVGAVPAYRALSEGAVGRDVAQLELYLARAGYLSTPPNDRFESATVSAIRELQGEMGIAQDGTMALGDIVFVPRLPARITLAEGITVGAPIASGAHVASVLASQPRFTITLSEAQAELVPLDGRVVIDHDAGTWAAQVDSVRTTAGEMELILAPVRKGAICRHVCEDAVPPEGTTLFRAHLIVVPTVTGPVVPASALMVDPSGTTYVVTTDNKRVPVTVAASDVGQSVVEGVEVGTELLLFAAAS